MMPSIRSYVSYPRLLIFKVSDCDLAEVCVFGIRDAQHLLFLRLSDEVRPHVPRFA